jgi:hypothetical protein
MREHAELFEALKRSPFRAKFKLGPRDLAYLHEKAMEDVVAHAKRFIAERLAPASPVNDGKQTPWRGHPVFVAQHATATCCRACLMKWHRIERGRELSSEEQDYIVGVITAWLKAQAVAPERPPQPGLF